MSQGVFIPPGLYLILLQDPEDAIKGPGGVKKDIAAPPPVYATAPVNKGNQKEDKNLGPITLETALDGGDRQIWQVKIVKENEQERVYTITRADGVWLPPERPPSFGYDGLPELRKPISCMGFKKPKPEEEMPPNPFKWWILHTPPADSWLQQSMYTIIPVPEPGQEIQCFIDNQTPAVNDGVEGYSAGGPREPEPAMVLNMVQLGVKAHTWYFEPYFQAS